MQDAKRSIYGGINDVYIKRQNIKRCETVCSKRIQAEKERNPTKTNCTKTLL